MKRFSEPLHEYATNRHGLQPGYARGVARHRTTIRELAELVLEVTGSSSELVFHPLPVDDPTQRQPDLTLARSALGWEPEIPLRTGLERTAEYFRRILGT